MRKVKSFLNFVNERFGDASFLKLGESGKQVEALQTALETLGFDLPQFGIDSKFGNETFIAAQKTISAIAGITNLGDLVNDPEVDKFNADGLTKTQYNILIIVGQNPEMVHQIRSHLGNENNGITANSPHKPGATPVIAPSADTANKTPSVNTGAGNEKAAYDFFISRGYSPAGAAGAVANLKTESGFKTTAVGDNGLAKSLAQWHPDRFNDLTKQGFNLNDFGSALAAIDHELKTAYPGVYNKIKNATSPQQAAADFDRGYERSAGTTTQTRMRDAQTIFSKYNSA